MRKCFLCASSDSSECFLGIFVSPLLARLPGAECLIVTVFLNKGPYGLPTGTGLTDRSGY